MGSMKRSGACPAIGSSFVIIDKQIRLPGGNRRRNCDKKTGNCHFSDKAAFLLTDLSWFLSNVVCGTLSFEIPLATYDTFVEQCEEASPEYEVLKNGFIFRRTKGKDIERFVKINCTLADANKLLLLATKVCPDAVVVVASGITTSLRSD
jgi:hypothetical protein